MCRSSVPRNVCVDLGYAEAFKRLPGVLLHVLQCSGQGLGNVVGLLTQTVYRTLRRDRFWTCLFPFMDGSSKSSNSLEQCVPTRGIDG
jgi:hypothetical protein